MFSFLTKRLDTKPYHRTFGKYILTIALFVYILLMFNAVSNHNTGLIEHYSERLSHYHNTSNKFNLDEDFSYEHDISSKIEATVGDYNENLSIKFFLHLISPMGYVRMPPDQETFMMPLCKHYQCLLTNKTNYFEDITRFDVITFIEYGFGLRYGKIKLPKERSSDQIYLFVSMESATTYPLCDDKYDDYFNFTCTYRLDSDVKCNYFDVLNEKGEVIGPNKDMNWIKTEDMRPVSDDLLEILKGKTKLVAWFVSNCFTYSKREEFVKDLQGELNKYDLEVDIYGKCGKYECVDSCDDILEKRFMFYLAFENAFDEDYVTEKVLLALRNSVVPIVYGGANYTRFMPDGSYLNARELGVERLAATLNHLLHNKDEYYKFFKWRNHYSFVRKQLYNVCEICRFVNEIKSRNVKKRYRNFREWWHPGFCSNNSKNR